MESAELRDELDCSICLSLYTDPVSLRCGHFFCRYCIVSALDAQEAAGVYSCPDCRAQYPERPALEKNRKLENIVERFSSAQPEMEETGTFCTYCDSPAPAVRTCLQCEASFCEKHLSRHSKSSEHMLVEPNVTLEGRKCSTHKEVLKYYCSIDKACICVSCWVAGDHKGHAVELLDVASEKKKEKIRFVCDKMKSRREEAKKRIQNLKDHVGKEEEKSAGVSDRVALLFTEIREKLDDLEETIQGEISWQKDQVSLSVSILVGFVKGQLDMLIKDINELEPLCNFTDPLTFLQEDLKRGDIKDLNFDLIGHVNAAQRLDEDIVSLELHKGFLQFADDLSDMKKRQFPEMEKSDILLDIDTAHNNIIISQDLRSASHTARSQNRPDGPKRFRSRQVLSSRSFSSGRHYWEVDVSQVRSWMIGVAGESLERKVNGKISYIGFNKKSWAIISEKNFFESHKNLHKPLVLNSPVRVVGVYLDYEAGRLSFYQVGDHIRHIHTFTASFSEPLYPALYLYDNCIIRMIK